MQNYSVTYASAITAFAGFLYSLLVHLHIGVFTSSGEVETLVAGLVATTGFLWQIIHRYSKGDVTVLGSVK